MKTMRDDPEKIANFFVQQHGLVCATEKVIDETTAAYETRDLYALSIWRDVRRILREREEAAAS